jgi:hypothetical protein
MPGHDCLLFILCPLFVFIFFNCYKVYDPFIIIGGPNAPEGPLEILTDTLPEEDMVTCHVREGVAPSVTVTTRVLEGLHVVVEIVPIDPPV